MAALPAPLPRIVAIEIRGVRRDVPEEAVLLRWIVSGEARAEDVCIDVTGRRVPVSDRVDLEDFLESARLLGRVAAPELTPDLPPPALASFIDMSFAPRDGEDEVERPTVVVPADLVAHVAPAAPAAPRVAPVVPSLVDMSFDGAAFGDGERPTVVVPEGALPNLDAPPAAAPRGVPNATEQDWLAAGEREDTETPWADDVPEADPQPVPSTATGSLRAAAIAGVGMLAALGIGVAWTVYRQRAVPEEGVPPVAASPEVDVAEAPVDAASPPPPPEAPAPVATGSASTASAGARGASPRSSPAPKAPPVSSTRPVAVVRAPPPATVSGPAVAPSPAPSAPPPSAVTSAPRDAASVIAEGWKTAEAGHFVAARALFGEAIGLGGGAAAYYGRGYAAGKLGDSAAAGDDYCRALAANPPSSQRGELNALLRKLGRTCN
ncbi:MAG: hypothetical protein RLZZ299_645 [Pseudomonadota bacterium]|jgi:hypothetical protein